MPSVDHRICTLVLAILTASATGALAAEAGRAWGTISNPGQAFLNSALMNQASGAIAQQEAAGRDGGPFKSVTACGTCTTITITGNGNSVGGNSITSTNSGTVSSTGTFNFDGF